MSAELAIQEKGFTPAELAKEINREHERVETYKHNTIQHAIRCGELLAQAKERVGHGNWLTWVEENFEASEKTATNYMRLAANQQRVADLDPAESQRSALRLLAQAPEREKPVEPKSDATNRMLAGAAAASGEAIIDATVVEGPSYDKAEQQRKWAAASDQMHEARDRLSEIAPEISAQTHIALLRAASVKLRAASNELATLAESVERAA